MTVPTEVGGTRYEGDGATSVYPVGFHFQAAADLEVWVTTTADLNTELTLNTHYTVTGAGDQSGGQITLIGAYANLTDGYFLTILLKPALNNSTAFTTSGKVSNAQIQAAMDRMSQRIISLQSQVDRCLKLPIKEAGSATTTTIPDTADRLSRSFTFDSSGNPSAGTAASAGELSVTAIGETIVEAANAGAVLDALGFTSATKAIVDDTTNGAILTTLGISAPAQTILDDASVSAIRTTLGLDGASGVLAALDLADAATAQIFQARLTLTSATAVTSADVTSASTIYLTPYKGNKIAVYTGTRWKLMALTEISLALTATSGKPYDVWVYDNSGTLTLETTVWTNDTTRATALALQDGVYCKTGALTRRYVGSFYAWDTNTTADSAAKRHLFNMYNRVRRRMQVKEADAGWSYTTAVLRQANDDATNQLDFLCGVAEDCVDAELFVMSKNTNADVTRYATIGVDGVNATFTNQIAINSTQEGTSTASNVRDHLVKYTNTLLGRHYLTWCEYSTATGTTTWYGSDTATGMHGGMMGWVWC